MKEKTIEDYPRINSWIKENTADGGFVSHPDFVEDTIMELLNDMEQLKNCIDEIAEADCMGEVSKTLRQYGVET